MKGIATITHKLESVKEEDEDQLATDVHDLNWMDDPEREREMEGDGL
jgi:hypothetical protein